MLCALNDFTVALWFLAGSAMVLIDPSSRLKIYLYLAGSIF
ncbi:YrhK family protein [Mesobacillus zeae]